MTIRQFFLAGKATATLLSKASGKHLTFKVKKGKSEDAPHFVSVLSGTDNETDFSFIGTIFADGNFRHGRKSTIGHDAPSVRAFDWLWRNADALPADKAELLPACACARCGRKLTVPTSIENALGPECARIMGLA